MRMILPIQRTRVLLGYVIAPMAAVVATVFLNAAEYMISAGSVENLEGLIRATVLLYVFSLTVGVPICFVLRVRRVRSGVMFMLCAIALAGALTPFIQISSQIFSPASRAPSHLIWTFAYASLASLAGFGVFWLVVVRSPNRLDESGPQQPAPPLALASDTRLVRYSLISAVVAVGTIAVWILVLVGLQLFGQEGLAMGLGYLTVGPVTLLTLGAYGFSVICGLGVVRHRPVVLWWVIPLVLPPLALLAGIVIWIMIWNVQRRLGP